MADEALSEGAASAAGSSRKTEIGAFLAFVVGLVVGVCVMLYVNRLRNEAASTEQKSDKARAVQYTESVKAREEMAVVCQMLGKAGSDLALQDLKQYTAGASAQSMAARKKISEAVLEAAKKDPDNAGLKELEAFVRRTFLSEAPAKAPAGGKKDR